MYPYNTNQNQLSQLLLQQAIQPQTAQQIIEVTGRNGANAISLGPRMLTSSPEAMTWSRPP